MTHCPCHILYLYTGVLAIPAPMGPSLKLDPVFSPPAVNPTAPTQMDYNAPEMDHMLEPIKVQVLDDNGDLILDPVMVTATTILTTNWNQTDNSGDTYTGTLCQHTNTPYAKVAQT